MLPSRFDKGRLGKDPASILTPAENSAGESSSVAGWELQAVVGAGGARDGLADLPQLAHLRCGQVVEDEPLDLLHVTGGCGDDLVPTGVGEAREHGAPVLRVGRASHPTSPFKAAGDAGQVRQSDVG